MRKYISIFLTLCLIICTFSLTIFANSSDSQTSLQEEPPKFTDKCSYEDTPLISISQSMDETQLETEEKTTNYHFNETNKSFLRKITAETVDLQGYTSTSSTAEKTPLNLYFAQTNTNRFEIIDIAYENEVINEEEKIEAYCLLLEQKRLDNKTCLFGIMTTLHRYALTETASDTIVKRIDSIFSTPQKSSTATSNQDILTFESELDQIFPYTPHSSEHFIIYYPSDIEKYPAGRELITPAIAAEAAAFFESVYNTFHNMGFRDPLLDTGETKIPVILNPNSHSYLFAHTLPRTMYGNACSMGIVLYDYQSLTPFMQETIAHEYFHAIECAYRYTFFPTQISEAFANWASIAGAGISTSFDDFINDYLESTSAMEQYPSYGSGQILYALTIQKECGVGAIVDIYEESELSERASVDFSQFKSEIVNHSLASWGESFNSIYLKMAGNNYAPNNLYASVHPGGISATSSWQARITSTTTTQATSRTTALQNALNNQTLNSFSSNYHVFTPDIAGKDSKITIKIVYSGTNALYGVAQCIYKTSEGNYVLETIPRTASLTFTYTNENYGDLEEFCIITSSLGGSGLTYTIDYHVERGSSSDITIASDHRYSEYVPYINQGEYQDYYVTFPTTGRRLIQTFGTLDSYIILYNASGTQLTYNDDAGYGSNALLSYVFSANTQYRIRVCFYSATTTGKTKLTITATDITTLYENITPKTDNTSIVSGYLYTGMVTPYTYKFSTTQNITVNVSSTTNVYLYVIDPRSVAPMRAAQNTYPQYTLNSPCLYNDDYNTTTQSQITKTFDAGVPYFVIVGMYDPTTGGGSSYYLRAQVYS